jgi:hypothetical protein
VALRARDLFEIADPSALADHPARDVYRVRDGFQVIGPYAVAPSTEMVEFESFRDVADETLVRQAMCERASESAVAVWAAPTRPPPTPIVEHLDARPERRRKTRVA